MAMDGKYYPDGVYDFKALISGQYYFVDKTLLIRDLCMQQNKILFYTRPRRFGKSLNLSMMDYYFNVDYKDEKIFDGLKIDGCAQCKQFKNAFPVIRMNFGDLESTNLDVFRKSLSLMVAKTIKRFRYLIPDEGEYGGESFIIRGSNRELDEVELNKSIRILSELLYERYGQKVIVLVDEYDVCIQNITSEDRFDEIVEAMRPFMQHTFKLNENLHLGVVTGIMPLTKTSMLSSFNNATICSILETEGDEFFGFTEDEVKSLIIESNTPEDKIDEIREWYDGYHFGDADVFNPYSVVMYLKNNCEPLSYWNNMTGGGLSKELLSNMGGRSLIMLKDLYEKGSSFRTTINTRISFADILVPSADPSMVYSYLAMAGYLNAVRTGRQHDGMPECTIRMVNREVSYAFKSLVSRASAVEHTASSALDSIYRLDAVTLGANLETMLSGISMDRTWSQDEDPTMRHNRYRDLIMAFLITPRSIARSEMPKGYGKVDILIDRTLDKPPVIIEVKTTVDRKKSLGVLAKEALDQINRNSYSDEPVCMMRYVSEWP